MRLYYNCIDLLKARLSECLYVNQIIYEDKIDGETLFPAVRITTKRVIDEVNVFSFVFGIESMERRNISNTQPIDKFVGNDNEIDNLNITSAILMRLLTSLRRVPNEYNISLTNVSDLIAGMFKNVDIIDGWSCEITLSCPNNITIC